MLTVVLQHHQQMDVPRTDKCPGAHQRDDPRAECLEVMADEGTLGATSGRGFVYSANRAVTSQSVVSWTVRLRFPRCGCLNSTRCSPAGRSGTVHGVVWGLS